MLFITVLAVLSVLPVMAQPGVTGTTAKAATDDAVLYKAGAQLGRALADRCSIFSGTVLKVGPLTPEDSTVEDPSAVLHAVVAIRIDEWLWNRRADLGITIQLDQIVLPETNRRRSENVWNGVDVQVGGRLIVAWRQNQDGPRKFGFVVSDVNLFPPIAVALNWHDQYMANASSLVSAPELGGDGKNPFFLGYFVNYLWRGGSFGSRDDEAIALGRLLTRIGAGAGSLASALFIRIMLRHLMLSEFNPVSETAQRSVTESLVIAGSSEDLGIAENAISVLVQLAAKGKLEMAPYLTAERSRRLRMNYNLLMQAGKIDKGQAVFDSQITRRTQP